MSLLSGVIAPVLWKVNRYFGDLTMQHVVHGSPASLNVPSGGTIALYGGAILCGVLAVLGLVAAMIASIRGVPTGICPACAAEINPVPAGATEITCESCKSVLKIADGVLSGSESAPAPAAVTGA